MVLKHFTRWDPTKLTLGTRHHTLPEMSSYWRQKLEGTDDQLTTPDSIGNLRDQLGALGEAVPVEIVHFLHGIVTSLVDLDKYAAELLKEYVFEEVRADMYPMMPSRRRCMFLFDHHDPEEYAAALKFTTSRHTLVEIETEDSGKLHKADLSLLDCNSLRYDGLVAKAHEYWSPSERAGVHVEYLYEGAYTIRRMF